MFPIDVAGSVRLKTVGRSNHEFRRAVIERIVDLLDQSGACGVTVEGDRVTFTVPFWQLAWEWKKSRLRMFDRGTLDIESEIDGILVRYRFRTVHQLLSVTVIVSVLTGLVAYAAHDRPKALIVAAVMFCLWWLFAFGLGFLIAKIHVPLWLRCGLRDLPES